ncbi:MAG: hypothetical protein NT076_01895 [Candidatus Pacearchaeota archaeon]|nr:hypothetical protein [Candidatus Pacearchaeota archaeon]
MKSSMIYSLIALVCIILMFTINWLFVIPAAFLSYLGWKKMMKV